MFQDNPLLAQLKQQIKETIPKKEGSIKATEKGFGFLEVDSKTSYFIPPAYMKKVMHGDKVVALIRTENDKEVAEPDELLEQSIDRFIGRVKMIRNKLNVVPDNPQLKDAIRAKTKKGLSHDALAEGDWVVATLIQHPLKGDNNFFCEISEKITDANDKIAPWWVTLAKHNLPNQEPAPQSGWEMLDESLTREDLTGLPFITIDSESTKDMDDALHTVANADGTFTLTIAIADPTAYVAQGTDLDKEARARGFTIYLPGRNIPMLPRELSDDLCSLREEEIRPALCCRVTVLADGTIADDATFFAATIKSQGRLAYDNVSDLLETGRCDKWTPSEVIAEQINALHGLAKARIAWREANAVTFPDRPDYRFELSEDNDVIAIHVDFRRIANRMVEEAMITANICAGRTLREHFGFGVFNTHSGFAPEKIVDAVELLNSHGGEVTAEALATLDGFSALRRWLNEQETTYLDNRIRKYQSYSEIGNTPAPHFAMGLDVYATWTSPIRKYGDMVNHRLLKAIIRGENSAQTPDETIGEELALHRKHHRMAERDVADWLYVRLLKDSVEAKTTFTAEIFDINRAGMRVRLLENGAMAFIPAPMIVDNKDRIECNGDLGTISVDGTTEFQLGDTIEVVLIDVKEPTRSIIGKPTREFAVIAEKAGEAEEKSK
ncbi:exoribonuclease II [Grimontia hollisae]|uniref:Exoribonuclease 2 n=2 Tax=Grimontia hollisae TaxID=673 RepID=D0I5N8_GRIHO|nr:exoribonuclease II [Grimontia hollisae]AMG29189.1 exoribonuclease II [Grimontia hollisae]EEY73202.1 exoribonuclease II [Grimontia hollisae CIP 101886]MDF2184944.1 exoribonuclease II [Grimontia hollisae]STO76711.1 Exoribonuclease 2 [Grimontia hollisae]STO98092.1 Exoribonuclease 2 [Grimontia hollisae]